MKRNLIFVGAAVIGCARTASIGANNSGTEQLDSARAASASMRKSNMSALASIEVLHRQDISATLSRDPRALASLWTSDAIRMQPGGPAESGKRMIYVDDSTAHSLSPRTQVVRYDPVIRDVQIAGDWAIEWGYFEGGYKRFPADSLHTIRGNLLRVLQRQRDGSWRFARVMWNSAE